jgi:hypothetical protein
MYLEMHHLLESYFPVNDDNCEELLYIAKNRGLKNLKKRCHQFLGEE